MSRRTPAGSQNPERDEKIMRLREAGLTYGQIGDVIRPRLSGERVRIIVAREIKRRAEEGDGS